jgi:basic membrane protein A and related proteins
MSKLGRLTAVVAILAIVASACATDEDGGGTEPTGGEPLPGEGFHGCYVSDTGGVDDRSFNQTIHEGMVRAETELGIEYDFVESQAASDYAPNLEAFVGQDCDLIVPAGFNLGTDTLASAEANPDQLYAIVDWDAFDFGTDPPTDITLDNLRELTFQTDQAAFLAGYLAAGFTTKGKVATYGGIKIPPVTIFMDGFADGVAHYNKTKSKSVAVLGWDKAKQDGLFAGKFDSPPLGKQLSDTLLAQGADVIMPVAGGTGLGTMEDAAGGKFAGIWVDVDGCESTQYCAGMLTTVVKNIPDAVRDAVLKGAKKESLAQSAGFIGTLANNGVSLAPYNQFDSKVDATLKSEVDKLKADIIAGTVKVESDNAPK